MAHILLNFMAKDKGMENHISNQKFGHYSPVGRSRLIWIGGMQISPEKITLKIMIPCLLLVIVHKKAQKKYGF